MRSLLNRCTATLQIAILILFACAPGGIARADGPPSPWSVEKAQALVWISVPAGSDRQVGSGFIVKGYGGNYYVVTASHTLLPLSNDVPADLVKCSQVLDGTVLREGDKGGELLVPSCVKHLGRDVSVIRLQPRDRPYSALQLSSHDLVVDDWLFLGGFPISLPRDLTRSGQVTATVIDESDDIVINAGSAPGFSGGPYLDVNGLATAIHRMGAKSSPGFARAVPFWQIRPSLNQVLGYDTSVVLPTSENKPLTGTVRREVVVMQYQPQSQVDALEEFLGIFRQKILAIPGTFRFATEERLGDLKIKTTNESLAYNEQIERWKANGASLMLMSGVILGSPNSRRVTSSIIIGEGDEMFPTESIKTQIAITPDQALAARDSNTVMLLYALAKDAHARKRPNAIIAGYLAEAQETAMDLAETDPQFKTLLNEITKTLQSLK